MLKGGHNVGTAQIAEKGSKTQLDRTSSLQFFYEVDEGDMARPCSI
jgi:hypothetical protein